MLGAWDALANISFRDDLPAKQARGKTVDPGVADLLDRQTYAQL